MTTNLNDLRDAELIVDAIRAAHTSREMAVALIATKLSSAWVDGMREGHRMTNEVWRGAQRQAFREMFPDAAAHQKDRDEYLEEMGEKAL